MVDPATNPWAALTSPPPVSSSCPFLARGLAAGDEIGDDQATDRCAAFSPPRSLAARQVEVVCLETAHRDCPLFVRAAKGGRVVGLGPVRPAPTPSPIVTPPIAVAPTPVMPVTRPSGASGARPAGSRPVPTLIAAGILVAALVAAFVFVSLRGGIALPSGLGPSGAPGQVAGATATPTAGQAATPTPAPTATPAPEPSQSQTGVPSSTAGAAPSATLPTAYAGLEPCPDRPDCYLYRVRSGDSLTRIADHFGISTKVLKAANPEIVNPNLLHVGDVLRIPLPPG